MASGLGVGGRVPASRLGARTSLRPPNDLPITCGPAARSRRLDDTALPLRRDRQVYRQLSSMGASNLSSIDPLRNARGLVALKKLEQQDRVLLQKRHLPMFGPEKPLRHE